MVESELRFLEVEIEGSLRHTFELSQPVFGEAPKRLDPIDVIAAISELVVTVTDSEMLGVSHVDQAVVAHPAVAVDDRIETYSSPDKALKSSFLGVWDNLSPDVVPTLENPEDDRLLAGATSTFAFDSLRSEIRLVNFDGSIQRRFSIANLSQAAADLEEHGVDRTDADTRESSCRAGRQVLAETAKKLTEFGLRNFRRSIVLVNPSHYRSIAPLHMRFAS